jgi:hypothetical protein
LAVGNNGESLVADSSATVGLRYSATPSASNPVLNSAFQIWQRGTSFSLAASTAYTSGYVADRWVTATNANQACTISRQVTNDTTNLPNIQYCLRYQRNSGQTGTTALSFVQNMESVNSIPYAGKTITVSFYARAGANYSAASSVLALKIRSGTGTDQNLFSTWTGIATVADLNATLTTTWQRFSVTGTVASTATQLAFYTDFAPTGTASTNDYYEVTGFQIDIGSVALPFRTYAATIQGELAACQRYFELCGFGSNVSVPAQAISTTASYGSFFYKVTKRGTPTIATSGGTFKVWNATATDVSATFQADSISVDGARIAAVSASGLVAGNAAALSFQNVTMTISAEL